MLNVARVSTVRPAGSSTLLRWLTAFGLSTSLGILVVGGIVLLGLRNDTWRLASIASENLAVVLSENIARNITTYDLSIQAARDAVRTAGLGDASAAVRHTAIFGRVASADYLGSLLILGADGRVTDASHSIKAEPLDLSDRDYFMVHRDSSSAGLFIGQPFDSRIKPGDMRIAISRRIDNADGSFAGVAVGTLRVAYFRDMFSRLDIGTKGQIAVLNRKGTLIANRPSSAPEVTDEMVANPSVRQGMLQSPAGQFTTTYAVDDIERLVSYRQIGSFPLVLVLGVSLDEIYAPWWRKTAVLGSMLGLLFLGNLGLCILFRREMLRRLSAEAALTAAAAELSVIASTDGLTGVANRRAFDAALHRAWRAGIRAQTPLALLMLDADCFKLFNDTFGHPAGDEVLRQIAAGIEKSIRRPNDFAARYGGEEFAVLLPDTESDGAIVIAERIRETVAALAVANPGAPTGYLSVSVGVGVYHPQADQNPEMLVARADEALFDGKRAGRNRVVLRQDTSEADLVHHLPERAASQTADAPDGAIY